MPKSRCVALQELVEGEARALLDDDHALVAVDAGGFTERAKTSPPERRTASSPDWLVNQPRSVCLNRMASIRPV
jgi:hypothetical protein